LDRISEATVQGHRKASARCCEHGIATLCIRNSEQLILHSVCSVSLLNDQGLDNGYYHINFLANRKDSGGSAVGFPVLVFTEAIVGARDEIDVHLCVLVDPLTDIGM